MLLNPLFQIQILGPQLNDDLVITLNFLLLLIVPVLQIMSLSFEKLELFLVVKLYLLDVFIAFHLNFFTAQAVL